MCRVFFFVRHGNTAIGDSKGKKNYSDKAMHMLDAQPLVPYTLLYLVLRRVRLI